MSEKSKQSLVKFDQNQSWLTGNYDSLIDDYGDNYVAVLEQEIIMFSEDIQSLISDLKSDYKSEYENIYIEFLFKEHPNFVL